MRYRFRLYGALVVVAMLGGSVQAQIPRLLSYQGVLTDTAGNPRPDGAYTLTFRLYGTESGGSALWTETKSLQVEHGLFSTLLGDVAPFGATLRFEQPYWLSIQLAGQAQMSPRLRLAAAGYSLNALRADTARFALGTPPAGVVDSARISQRAHQLVLPSESQTGASDFALLIENSGVGDGLRAYSYATQSNYAAVYGVNLAATGVGSGVFGYSGRGAGIHAESQDYDGLEAITSAAGKSAVYAHATPGGYGGTLRGGLFGLQVGGKDSSLADNFGDIRLEGAYGEIFAGDALDLYSNRNVIVDLDEGDNDDAFFRIVNGTDGIAFTVYENGNTIATGTKSAQVHTASFGDRLVYAMESPEVWLEDVGGGNLISGIARVAFEPVFAQTISRQISYHVFLTPVTDKPVLLSVSEKGPGGFTVRGWAADGTPVDCAFDYRVAAKRLGYEDVRLAAGDEAPAKGESVRVTPAEQPEPGVRPPFNPLKK